MEEILKQLDEILKLIEEINKNLKINLKIEV
jgi:hypothetical protein